MEGRPLAGLSSSPNAKRSLRLFVANLRNTKRRERPPVFPSTNCVNSGMICNSSIALRGIFLDNLHAALDAPTALNVTVQATRRREVRRSSRPREYLPRATGRLPRRFATRRSRRIAVRSLAEADALGRPPVPIALENAIRTRAARSAQDRCPVQVDPGTVQRIGRPFEGGASAGVA